MAEIFDQSFAHGSDDDGDGGNLRI